MYILFLLFIIGFLTYFLDGFYAVNRLLEGTPREIVFVVAFLVVAWHLIKVIQSISAKKDVKKCVILGVFFAAYTIIMLLYYPYFSLVAVQNNYGENLLGNSSYYLLSFNFFTMNGLLFFSYWFSSCFLLGISSLVYLGVLKTKNLSWQRFKF